MSAGPEDGFRRALSDSLGSQKKHKVKRVGPKYSWLQSFHKVVMTSLPIILTCVCATAVGLINVYFMGNQTDSALIAGVGMGSMLINVCFFAVGQGLNGAIETFVSQANGAG